MRIYLDASITDINSAMENLAKVCTLLVDRDAVGDGELLDYVLTKIRELMIISKKLEAKKRLF